MKEANSFTDRTWTPDRLATIKQFASDAGVEYVPPERQGYWDAPTAFNPENKKEVVYMNGYDLWLDGEVIANNRTRKEALDWITSN